MKNSFAIFALGAVVAAVLVFCWSGASKPGSAAALAPAPAAITDSKPVVFKPTDGDELLRQVVLAIDGHASIAAKLRERIDLFGFQLNDGEGQYAQQGRGGDRKYRCELKVSIDDVQTSLLHVCDGRDLWIFQSTMGESSLAKIDLERVRGARPVPKSVVADQQRQAASGFEAALGVGGLPQLLTSLRDEWRFTDPKEDVLDTLAVWTVEGAWRPAAAVRWAPDHKAELEAGAELSTFPLPDQTPTKLVLKVGRDDLFPYRVEYWKHIPAKKKQPAEDRLIGLLELYEVRFGAALPPALFEYQRGELRERDLTSQFLEKRGLIDAGKLSSSR